MIKKKKVKVVEQCHNSIKPFSGTFESLVCMKQIAHSGLHSFFWSDKE